MITVVTKFLCFLIFCYYTIKCGTSQLNPPIVAQNVMTNTGFVGEARAKLPIIVHGCARFASSVIKLIILGILNRVTVKIPTDVCYVILGDVCREYLINITVFFCYIID